MSSIKPDPTKFEWNSVRFCSISYARLKTKTVYDLTVHKLKYGGLVNSAIFGIYLFMVVSIDDTKPLLKSLKVFLTFKVEYSYSFGVFLPQRTKMRCIHKDAEVISGLRADVCQSISKLQSLAIFLRWARNAYWLSFASPEIRDRE